MNHPMGRKKWAIPEGYIPPYSTTTGRELLSHEAFCILNTSDQEAHVKVTIFFQIKIRLALIILSFLQEEPNT